VVGAIPWFWSSFLEYRDAAGHVADFHALRKTFITNLCRAGVSPKAAQTLARHSDINLTMNVYTMLTFHDQASAMEALPAIPQQAEVSPPREAEPGVCGRRSWRCGRQRKVPTVVPRGAENGAVRLASRRLRIASVCTEGPPPRRRGAG